MVKILHPFPLPKQRMSFSLWSHIYRLISATEADKKKQSVTVVDNRTGKKVDIPIKNGTLSALAFRDVSATPGDNGLMYASA